VIPLEKQILTLLQQMDSRLQQIDSKTQQMDNKIQQMNNKIQQMDEKINHMEEKLDLHGEILKEQSLILGALINGQEGLKAELSEMRLQNAKEFGEIKAKLNSHEDSIEI
jgi:uncharacterized protein (DUF3084 family)